MMLVMLFSCWIQSPNIDSCTENSECREVFGFGYECQQGNDDLRTCAPISKPSECIVYPSGLFDELTDASYSEDMMGQPIGIVSSASELKLWTDTLSTLEEEHQSISGLSLISSSPSAVICPPEEVRFLLEDLGANVVVLPKEALEKGLSVDDLGGEGQAMYLLPDIALWDPLSAQSEAGAGTPYDFLGEDHVWSFVFSQQKELEAVIDLIYTHILEVGTQPITIHLLSNEMDIPRKQLEQAIEKKGVEYTVAELSEEDITSDSMSSVEHLVIKYTNQIAYESLLYALSESEFTGNLIVIDRPEYHDSYGALFSIVGVENQYALETTSEQCSDDTPEWCEARLFAYDTLLMTHILNDIIQAQNVEQSDISTADRQAALSSINDIFLSVTNDDGASLIPEMALQLVASYDPSSSYFVQGETGGIVMDPSDRARLSCFSRFEYDPASGLYQRVSLEECGN